MPRLILCVSAVDDDAIAVVYMLTVYFAAGQCAVSHRACGGGVGSVSRVPTLPFTGQVCRDLNAASTVHATPHHTPACTTTPVCSLWLTAVVGGCSALVPLIAFVCRVLATRPVLGSGKVVARAGRQVHGFGYALVSASCPTGTQVIHIDVRNPRGDKASVNVHVDTKAVVDVAAEAKRLVHAVVVENGHATVPGAVVDRLVFHGGRNIPGCGYALVSARLCGKDLHIELLSARDNRAYTRSLSLAEATETTHSTHHTPTTDDALHDLVLDLCNHIAIVASCITFT